MIHVGFTGTRQGMTEAQIYSLRIILCGDIFHHGDCVGADAQAHQIAREKQCKVVLHPPTNPYFRAHCEADETRPKYTYLERNHHIVNESHYLIAAPYQATEVTRSGTWATVRYARKLGKPILIIEPDGKVNYSDWRV